ncbi:MAG: endonuclease III [Eubacteriales bacterium]|nr:endonuclease III [Eubacteriales bacterium]
MGRVRPDGNVEKILQRLDELYGLKKEGFPYEADWQLLCAIILSAQSTDLQVEAALPKLYADFPDAAAVARAELPDIEADIRTVGLYRSKARNIKACCTQLCERYDGAVPKTLAELLRLKGVGRKTATLFLADMYGIPGVTVDTHVFRIAHRLGWSDGKNPAQTEQDLMRILPKEHWNRVNFQLIYLGRSVCTARRAKCEICPLADLCEKHCG